MRGAGGVGRVWPQHGDRKITDTFKILLFANEPEDESEFAFWESDETVLLFVSF